MPSEEPEDTVYLVLVCTHMLVIMLVFRVISGFCQTTNLSQGYDKQQGHHDSRDEKHKCVENLRTRPYLGSIF